MRNHSSNLCGRPKLLILKNFYQSVAQPGRALRLGRRCCWFKSSHFDFFMQGYTVGVAGQTVNLLSSDSGSATLSPCTSFFTGL